MCKEDEGKPGCLTLEYVTSKLEWTWRRIDADAKEVAHGAAQGITQGPANAAQYGLDATQKALVASAAAAVQIVAEKAAVKFDWTASNGSGTPSEEIAWLKSENAEYVQPAGGNDRSYDALRRKVWLVHISSSRTMLGNASSIAEEEAAGAQRKEDTPRIPENPTSEATTRRTRLGNATVYFALMGPGLDEKIAFAGRARVRVLLEEPGNKMDPIFAMEKKRMVEKLQVDRDDGQDLAGVKTRSMKKALIATRYGEGKDGG